MSKTSIAIRQKLILGVLAIGKFFAVITKGFFPKSIFITTPDIKKHTSKIKITDQDKTSVTIAKFDKNGNISKEPFKILTATDLHLDAKGDDLNKKSINYLIKQINDTHPDLVIFTGDIVLSNYQQIDAMQFAQMMEKTGVYWAYVFGNHETREEKGKFKQLMFSSLIYYPHCLSRFGDETLFGYGNCAIHIKNGPNSLLQSLFLFDSGRNIQTESKKVYSIPDNIDGYDFLKKEQIQWYLKEKNKVDTLFGSVKTMCYMHIPLPEYKNAFVEGENGKYVPSEKCKILYGNQIEDVASSPFNSGFFDIALNAGGLNAIFAGHDHVNDFCALYKGVCLVYTQAGGYNSYNAQNFTGYKKADETHGATLTEIESDGSIKITQRKNREYYKN